MAVYVKSIFSGLLLWADILPGRIVMLLSCYCPICS